MKENIKTLFVTIVKIVALFAILFFATGGAITILNAVIDYIEDWWKDWVIIVAGFIIIDKYLFKGELINKIKSKIFK